MHSPKPWQNRRPNRVVTLHREAFDAEMESRGARSDAEVAALLGVTRTSVYKVRQGIAEPGVGFVAAILALDNPPLKVLGHRTLTARELGRAAA